MEKLWSGRFKEKTEKVVENLLLHCLLIYVYGNMISKEVLRT